MRLRQDVSEMMFCPWEKKKLSLLEGLSQNSDNFNELIFFLNMICNPFPDLSLFTMLWLDIRSNWNITFGTRHVTSNSIHVLFSKWYIHARWEINPNLESKGTYFWCHLIVNTLQLTCNISRKGRYENVFSLRENKTLLTWKVCSKFLIGLN